MSAIAQMFDGIAPTYDALNRVLSLGIDQRWRRRAVDAIAPLAGKWILDVCAGTLDLSRLCEREGANVVAVDFARAMLERGRGKLRKPRLVCADALRMPFLDGSFDGALCGFGLRNLPDPAAGLREMRRVLASGAKLAVLDFFRPAGAARVIQSLYNRRLVPLVGGALSGDRAAYAYLAKSIERFASVEEAMQMMRDAGFVRVRSESLTLGVAALLVGEAP
jgi:ubiquinone/menaquinone biosynthesis methyltransferase